MDAIDANKNMKAQFAMGWKNQKFGPNATRGETGDLTPNKGVSRLQAIESCLNSEESVIDCSKAANLAIQVGVLKQGDTLSDSSFEAGTLKRNDAKADDWVPGDRGLLKSFAGHLQPENVLYQGGGIWRGHDSPKPHDFDAGFMAKRSDIETTRIYPSTGIRFTNE